MKKYIAPTIAILMTVIFVSHNSATAGDSSYVHELAESGITIEFSLPAEKMMSRPDKPVRAKTPATTIPAEKVRVFEMGESGQTFSFPMTVREIAEEQAEIQRLAANQRTTSPERRPPVDTFELAESGIAISFSDDRPAQPQTSLFAGKKFVDNSLQ